MGAEGMTPGPPDPRTPGSPDPRTPGSRRRVFDPGIEKEKGV